MEEGHHEGHWEEHSPLGAPQASISSGRSSRPRRDSHSRRHHREREGGRGSTKSKNPSHRSTRYKEKFHTLRDKYDRVLAIREAIDRDLHAAAEKMERIQAENDLLLDAIYTAAPEIMGLVSPLVYSRPLSPQKFPTSPYHSRPPTHDIHPRFSPPPPQHSTRSETVASNPSASQNNGREVEQSHENQMVSSPNMVRASPRVPPSSTPATVHAPPPPPPPAVNGREVPGGIGVKVGPHLHLGNGVMLSLKPLSSREDSEEDWP